ncbi:hypothetical protein [Arthrobacter humicola]
MSDPLTTVATTSRTYTVTGREVRTNVVLLVVPLVRAATGVALPSRGAQPFARTNHAHTRARIASGGFLIVAGRADLALRPAPATSTTITVELAMPGEPVLTRDFTIPTGATLPVHHPAWELDDPVRTITGTVRRKGFPFPPVPQAQVAAGSGTAGAPFVLALRAPLALDHASGQTVRACTLTAGPVTALESAVAAAATSVVLISNVGIIAGTVLEFGANTVREQVIAAGTGPAPGEVRLRTPVVHSAASGTVVSTFTGSVSGPVPKLVSTARAGDGVVLLDSLPSALASAIAVRIQDSGRSEVRNPHAVTGADGHFRLAGVRNFALLSLTASGPTGTGQAVTTGLDPGGGPIDVDLAVP